MEAEQEDISKKPIGIVLPGNGSPKSSTGELYLRGSITSDNRITPETANEAK